MSTDQDMLLDLKDTQESQILPKLSSLASSELAPLVPLLLSWLIYPSSGSHENGINTERRILSRETSHELSNLLISRLTAAPPSTDDPLVAEIHTTLVTPSITAESVKSKSALFYWHGVLVSLPKDRMEPYREALVRLSKSPTTEERAYSLDSRCRYILEFMDASCARVPDSKFDELAVRSLEMVQTAEEMSPLVPVLLCWIADMNWPVASGCWDQLARFPELTIDPIRAVLRSGDDAGLESNLLDFLLRAVPRPLMERVRPEIERVAQRPTEEEIEYLTVDSVNDCLEAMDQWAARMKILGSPKAKMILTTDG
ncbi:hypothetical protein B0H13DRAFT_2208742 [Mycena leptocephala]|nr:hypothetical protein B0H13DRAFT_2208742 [Mycena leptocephala]